MTEKSRLSQTDWLAAGFRMLATEGPSSLKAEVLARALGTTKGSFYWHFADLPAYKAALLAEWRSKAALAIIDTVNAISDPRARLDALITAAQAPAPDAFGGRLIEPAIRAWALSDPLVHQAMQETDAIRLSYLQDLLTENGVSDTQAAEVFYGAFVGLDHLAAHHDPQIMTALSYLIDRLLPPQATT